MTKKHKTIACAIISTLAIVGCSPRNYLHEGFNGYNNTYTLGFSAPQALESKNSAPNKVATPKPNQSQTPEQPSQNKPQPTPTTTTAQQSTRVNEIENKETQYINFTTYNPFKDLGNDTFYLDLAVAENSFLFPINGEMSSQYGVRNGRPHQGIDFRAPKGTSIHAVFDGVVRLSRNYAGYGNVIVIRHYNGLETVYSHNDQNLVNVGDRVNSGDKIATCGSTGQATGNHLHFEVRVNGIPINPNLILDTNNKTIQNGVVRITQQGENVVASLQKHTQPPVVIAQTEEERGEEEDEETEEKNTVEYQTVAANESKGMRIGDKIVALPPQPAKYHTLQNGETLSHLAVKYDTTVKEICELNNIASSAYVRVGQKIRVK